MMFERGGFTGEEGLACATFRIAETGDGQYVVKLIAARSDVILTSPPLHSEEWAERAIACVKDSAARPDRYERRKGGGGYYFVLKHLNGQVIGTSELYWSEHARNNGMLSVEHNAKLAALVR